MYVWVQLYYKGQAVPQGNVVGFDVKEGNFGLFILTEQLKSRLQTKLEHCDDNTIDVYPPGTTVTAAGAEGNPCLADRMLADLVREFQSKTPSVVIARENPLIAMSPALPFTVLPTFGSYDGVNPDRYQEREVLTKVLDILPQDFHNPEELMSRNKKRRIMLLGPPGSGKTSILGGGLFAALKSRYRDVPVFYVNGKDIIEMNKVVRTIHAAGKGVVVLDDAQLWYGEGTAPFWAHFKTASYFLIAAATYSVNSANLKTPVVIEDDLSSELSPDETSQLYESMGVDTALRPKMSAWFGNNYGMIEILGGSLLDAWKKEKEKSADLKLEKFFYRASTFAMLKSARFVPDINDELIPIFKRMWNGQLDSEGHDFRKLKRYGVLKNPKEFTCEFVERLYFSQLFHSHDYEWKGKFVEGKIPSSLELVDKGMEEIEWQQLQSSRNSSTSGFPIENVWQSCFYSSIGHYIPKDLTFCKEEVTGGNRNCRIDFVLRKGETRGIEFLVNSDRVAEHHERFEDGGCYYGLGLDDYIVVDIIPWTGPRKFHVFKMKRSRTSLSEAAFNTILSSAERKFRHLTTERRLRHAIFFVSDSLDYGVLYSWDGNTNTAVKRIHSFPVNSGL